MYKSSFLILFLFFGSAITAQTDSQKIAGLYKLELLNGQCYENLRELCKNVGTRLSGSPGAAKAVTWGFDKLKSYGFDTVYLQEITVPHWVRGKTEKAILVNTKKQLQIAALGGSVGTNGWLSGEIIEVNSNKQLDSLGKAGIAGKIVFYNRPMDQAEYNTFNAYGGCVDQRYSGAANASKYGAIAVLIRSVTHAKDHHAHTGSMKYDDNQPKIPAAAVSTLDANLISLELKKGKLVKIKLNLSCITLPDAPSHNVIAEIKGTADPDKVICWGGHLDCWDKGEGAHDDGAGIVHSMEALWLIKQLKVKPRYTLRCVLFMNEENGNRGGLAYAANVKKINEKHIAALESDRGGFVPRGFCIDGDSAQVTEIRKWRKLLEPYGLHFFEPCGSGVDISPLKKGENAPFKDLLMFGLVPDSQRYFDVHHANSDVFESVNERELKLGSAAMAAMILLLDGNQ